MYGQEVSTAQMKIYLLALEGEMNTDELNAACTRALKVCKFFPKPAEILDQITAREKDGNQLEGERAWVALQEFIREWGTDLMPLCSGGRMIGPPPLDDATAYAVRQCGGYSYVSRPPEESAHWVRKNFLEHYSRFTETDGLSRICGSEESRRLIEKYAPLLAGKPKFQRRELKPKNAPEPELAEVGSE